MSHAPSYPRQTQRYLQELFAKRGIATRSRLGQNFLIDLNLQKLIVDTARLTPNDVVLEVGAGTGGLTLGLAARAAHVVAVEIDSRFYELALDTIADCTNVTLLHTDVLKSKNHLSPIVIEEIERLLEPAASGRVLKLVANLPYQIATPVISNLLATDLPLQGMTVTLQHEMGDRLLARPRTKDYSSLSIWFQALTQVTYVRRLPPSVFWPRPAVNSCIVQIEPKPALRSRIHNVPRFHKFIRRMFLHRRKTLANTLSSEYKKQFSKPQAAEFFESHGIDSRFRAEQLTVVQWIELANDFAERFAE